MKSLLNWIMVRRARQLTHRLRTILPAAGRIADVGSGTGHNADVWRRELGATVDEFDVSDLHWVGAAPTLFDGATLPAPSSTYDAATLLFVLQYPEEPVQLLREAQRISVGRVVVLQSTFRGEWGRFWLNVREFVWGRLAFQVARVARTIPAQDCPVESRRAYSRDELRSVFREAGFRIHAWEPEEWYGLNISRDLYVLEPIRPTRPSRSSFPPAMKCGG